MKPHTKTPPIIELSKPQTAELSQLIKDWLSQEADLDLGLLQAEQLLERLLEKLGPLAYNRAILDAQALLSDRFELLQSDLWALEK